MSRWLLALLFAFGTVSFITACDGENETEVEKAADDAADKTEDVLDDAGDGIQDATD